jgi:Domain of unknown function (DUF4328)
VQAFVALMNFIVLMVSAVFFLIWLNRAYKNLAPLKARHLEFSSGWAVGWWFVPFANLIKPFYVTREVWCESDPEFEEGPSFLSASFHTAPTYMVLRWISWVVMNILAKASDVATASESRDSIALSGNIEIVAGLAAVVSAILAIAVVRDITSRQEQRFQRVGVVQPPTPPPPPVFEPNV